MSNLSNRPNMHRFYGRVLREDKAMKQLLAVHLRNVAQRALESAREAQPIRTNEDQAVRQWREGFLNTAQAAGLLHDLGKYRKEFQEYLLGQRDRSTETNHAAYGSAAATHQFGDDASAFAIAGHHAGLHDLSMLDDLINGSKYSAHEKYGQLLTLAQGERELGAFPESNPVTMNGSDDSEKHRYEFMIRMLFSIIVDSDRLDAEQWEMEQKTGKLWQRQSVRLDAKTLLERVQTVREQKKRERPEDDLNHLRNAIFDACVAKGERLPQGFFSLTVPTGGGKTLSSMAFALAHAKNHDLRRVIVVIPYLSIIEQNAKEYRDALGDGIVLEHHSAVEVLSDARRPISGEPNEPTNVSDLEKAIENWDMPVIVTTSVQFIETLFAASPGQTRKLHSIAQSVVIFDEVQTLPAHLLEPTLNVLRELKDHWGVSILFCSATQPAFKKSAALKNGFEPNEMAPIVSEPERVFKTLRRVDYHIESRENPVDWRTLAERMISHPQALSVLNVRRQAFGLWEALHARLRENGHGEELEGEALFHLSSAMCPAHRLDLLGVSKNPPSNNIKTRLKCGKPCWVASTQLVEAGVDIDFPVVFGPWVLSIPLCRRPVGVIEKAYCAIGREICVVGRSLSSIPPMEGFPPGFTAVGRVLLLPILNRRNLPKTQPFLRNTFTNSTRLRRPILRGSVNILFKKIVPSSGFAG